MGWPSTLHLVFLSWALLASTTHQLQTYERQILLQLRKHLEYPIELDAWQNYYGDLCTLSSTTHMSITCQDNSVTELKIMGDKLAKVSEFNGFALPNQTLSQSFSVDSFVTTLTRLTNLRVVSLVSLGMWGPLPDKIHRLSSLELLDVSSNFLFGTIPAQLSRMVRLHTLTLDGNFFNDTVPDWFDSLTKLTVLSLKNNRLKGQFPSSLTRITSLTDIILSHNALAGKLPDMSALTGLHLLDLRENHFDSQLPSLPKGLTTILLSNNSLSGEIPQELGELQQLQHLDLSNNFLTGTPPSELFSLQNISYLNVASNVLSGSLPQRISCGDALGFVDISNNRFIGSLPSCLDSNSGKRIVKFGWNCLSIDTKNQHSKSFCEKAVTVTQSKRFSGKAIVLLAGVIGGILIIVVLLLVGLLIFRRRQQARGAPPGLRTVPKVVQDNPPSAISSELLANARIISQAAKLGAQGTPVYRLFSMEELEEATGRFDQSTVLGAGSIGKIYKGRLQNGNYVAIRSLALHKKFLIRNLKLRLDLLSKLRHPHLVGLLGHCIDGEVQDDSTVNRVLLVYEFVPNGNFHTHLSETSPEKVLNWSDRLAVLIGIAKAVHFLHTGVIPPSTCNRLKTRNILLDEHRVAKLSDYGMSIVTEDVEKSEARGDGSKSWHMSKLEDDVYNFGFILLESLVGPIGKGKGEAFLLKEMTSFGSQDGRRKIVDPIVLTTSSQESLSIVISLTNKCISPDSSRPSFEDVLWNLQYAAQVQATADVDQKSDAASLS
ncbi:probable inactive leucine-rich repeat receptor-like protein kinase At3g03770 [Coffea eugenioides]|uniref:Probable inactive leucine-rich repeat receptor-like protein kinase At3g03770 n=1 Tax=Coffea arabica TaxID=13443 RepID=A0A6P6VJ38_COFAR|nr:probable inactive leucine-rich repeat receptor-like protein kinase At3g03770 [Coffea arabica]XP_027154129.1 probable inactive leucine-rich repeat receptor-like protein kinase At3g03770 [Coffea eugenioides]